MRTQFRELLHIVGIVIGTGCFASVTWAGDCNINNDNETVEVENDGVTIKVYYDEGNCSTVGDWPLG